MAPPNCTRPCNKSKLAAIQPFSVGSTEKFGRLINRKIWSILSRRVVRNPIKFHENRLQTFNVILVTVRQTSTAVDRRRRLHYLVGGCNNNSIVGWHRCSGSTRYRLGVNIYEEHWCPCSTLVETNRFCGL